MVIKKSVEILGLSIPVKFGTPLVDESGNVLFGYYDADKREIMLNSEQTPESLIRTFLHEMGHAFLDRIGIRVALTAEMQEILVEGFANVWYENFVQKPKKKKK